MKTWKKYRFVEPEFFLGFETELDFERPWFSESPFYSAPSIFAVFRNLVQKIWFKKSSLRKVVLQTRIFFWFEKSRWSEKQCHTNFCNQRCFCTYLQFWTVREDTALSLLEAWGCKVLGYSQRNFLPTLNTKILFFCLPPSQSCRHNTFCLQKCFLHELTILNGVRGHCSVLAGGLRTQSSRSFTTQFSAKRPQLNEKNIYAPTYLLLPLGNWGSKWGDFHWAMGCV